MCDLFIPVPGTQSGNEERGEQKPTQAMMRRWDIVQKWQWRIQATARCGSLGNQCLIQKCVEHAVGKKWGRYLPRQ